MATWFQRRAERKAEGRRRWEEARREKEQGVITVPCRYLGGTAPIPEVLEGSACWLKLGASSLEVRNDSDALLALEWSQINEIELEDASGARTYVEKHSYGWFGGLLQRMPVAMSGNKVRCYMGVKTAGDEFLFELDWDVGAMRGHVLRTKPRWGRSS